MLSKVGAAAVAAALVTAPAARADRAHWEA